MRLHFAVGVAGLWFASIACGMAQGVPAAGTMNDPVALLDAAREKNGLNSSDVKPWHIRGTYTIYDPKGGPSDTGVYEEWWAGPARYKRSFSGGRFNQVEYATGTGLYRTGSQDWLGGEALVFRTQLLAPLLSEQLMEQVKPLLSPKTAGNTGLNCVTLTYPIRSNLVVAPDFYPADCFQQDAPVLRMASSRARETLYNQTVLFQGHYLSKELHGFVNGKPAFDLKLDVIEGLKSSEDPPLTPPADSAPVNLARGTIKLNRDESQALRVKLALPEYPAVAKRARVEGAVVLETTIGKDGHVSSTVPMSGPPLLYDAAVEAVRQWVYQPFLVMGQPMEVIVEATVNFNFGHSPR